MNAILKGLAKSLSDSTDVEVRDMGVAYLLRQIPETKDGQLSRMDLAKIWRGLFFCMWHSDGPFVQDALAEKIGSMVCLWQSNESRMEFSRAFFNEMREMWDKIDDLRADKFRRLARCVITYTCRALALAKYDDKTVEAFRSILFDFVYDTTMPQFPVGLTVYFSSIILECLELAAVEVAGPAANGKKGRKQKSKPKIAFEEDVVEGAEALMEDEDEVAAEQAIERAGDSMQKLQLQLERTRRSVFAKNNKKPCDVKESVTAAILDAIMRYYLSGTNKTIVNTITEAVLDALCCSDRFPHIQRDMDGFLDRMNETLGDEELMKSPGGRRLAHYYAHVLEFKQRGWKKVADEPVDAERIKRNVFEMFDPESIASRQRKERRDRLRAGKGKLHKKTGKKTHLSFRKRRKLKAKRSLHL